jgi:hypothetical protein
VYASFYYHTKADVCNIEIEGLLILASLTRRLDRNRNACMWL